MRLTPILSIAILMGLGVFAEIPRARAQELRPEAPGMMKSALRDLPEPALVAKLEKVDEEELQQFQRSSSTTQANCHISGTIKDLNGDIVPGAIVRIESTSPMEPRTVLATESGEFEFGDLSAGIPYRITVEASGLESWTSESVVLNPGQYFFLTGISLKVPDLVTSVTVHADQVQIATEQVNIETKQRVLGFIPNFYVTYDPNAAPLTTGLKYKLAFRSVIDPMTFVGVAFMSAVYQAGDLPDYGQGWDNYAKRMGAAYADTSSALFIGGAILPSMLHQDPRYFYQGTGSKKSRTFHALFSPFICKGDNGSAQPNFSSIGGDLATGAISNIYYPDSNRGAKLLFQGFMVTTGARMINAVVQEFLLRKLTPSARAKY